MRLVSVLLLAACTNCASPQYKFYYSDSVSAMEFRSSVRIGLECEDGNMYAGTGVAIGPNAVITVRHLMAACPIKAIFVKSFDEEELIPAHLVRIATDSDAALIRTDKPMVAYVPSIRREWDVRVGEYLCFVGGDRLGLQGKKCGYVAVVTPQTKTFIVGWPGVSGNSGGPVFDAYGRLVGIATHGRSAPDSDQLAMIHSVNSFLDLL